MKIPSGILDRNSLVSRVNLPLMVMEGMCPFIDFSQFSAFVPIRDGFYLSFFPELCSLVFLIFLVFSAFYLVTKVYN